MNYQLIIGMLTTWRVSHLLHAENGPWQLLAKLRKALSRNAALHQLFDCFYCLSMWVAMPFAYLLGTSWTEQILLVPALSAAAILVERVTQPPMPEYVEEPITGPSDTP